MNRNLDERVMGLSLPTRAVNALEGAGIETVDDLCSKRPEDLLVIPYFGVGQLRDVEQALAEIGRKLRPPAPPPLISAREAGQRRRRQRERALRKREPNGREAVIAKWVRARHGSG